jgi:hypothetical protein
VTWISDTGLHTSRRHSLPQRQYSNQSSLDNKKGDDSLFVALAWCEAIGRAE